MQLRFGRTAFLVAILLQSLVHAAPAHRGVNLVWFSPTVDQRVVEWTLDNAVASGVDHVSLNVWWFQDNISSTQVAPDFSRYSSTDATLRQVIDAAHARSLTVQLRPLVDLANDPSHWRGQITGGSAWFNNAGGYGDYIRHMADIAQEKNVALFSVGGELEATVGQSSDWRNLIDTVRARYDGDLVYAANWGNPAIGPAVSWWDAVDYIGIDAYYPLTGINNPTPAQLDSAWMTRGDQITSWLNSTAPGKQILFTEVGYMNVDGTNREPWSYNAAGTTDQHEQADAYDAMLEKNWNRSWFAGAHPWAWDLNPNPDPRGYETLGKLAHDVLLSHYVPGYSIGGTWTGATGSLWTDTSNWSNGAVPGNLTAVTFDSAGAGNTNINLGGNVTVARLRFDNAPPAYTFQSGSTLTFNSGGGITITNTVSTNQTLHCAVALDGPAMFANAGTGQLIVNGQISAASAGTKRLTLYSNGGGQLNGAIADGAGAISLFKAGTGTWVVAGNNSFTGEVAIYGGNLNITHNNALGSPAGGTVVANAASLQLTPGLTVAFEPIQITGSGAGGQGALQLLSGAGSWGGMITVVGDAQIANRAFNGGGLLSFTISGRITGGSRTTTLAFRGSNSFPGSFRLAGADNDYLGKTYVWGTKLILAAGDDTLPITTVVELDTLGRPLTVDSGVLDLNGNNQRIAGLTDRAAATPARVVNRGAGTLRTLTIDNAEVFIFAGQINNDLGQIRLAKSGAGIQTLAGASSYTGGTDVSGGILRIAHAGALGSGSVQISGGATLRLAPALAPPMGLPSVEIAGAPGAWQGYIDVADGAIIINSTSSIPIATIADQIHSAYADGSWSGTGITSSLADAAHGVGYRDSGGTITISYARYGDASLDGTVGLDDFNVLASNFGTSGRYWFSGDFSYEGLVNLDDFNLLAGNFGLSAASDDVVDPQDWAALRAVVPEPSAQFCGLVASAATVLRRRRV